MYEVFACMHYVVCEFLALNCTGT